MITGTTKCKMGLRSDFFWNVTEVKNPAKTIFFQLETYFYCIFCEYPASVTQIVE